MKKYWNEGVSHKFLENIILMHFKILKMDF